MFSPGYSPGFFVAQECSTAGGFKTRACGQNTHFSKAINKFLFFNMEISRRKRSVLKEWLKDDDDDYIWQTMFHPLSMRMIQSTIESRKRSRKGRAPNIDRKREAGALALERDYWGNSPIYDEAEFRRRFRMSRRLFDRIVGSYCCLLRYTQPYLNQKNCFFLIPVFPGTLLIIRILHYILLLNCTMNRDSP